MAINCPFQRKKNIYVYYTWQPTCIAVMIWFFKMKFTSIHYNRVYKKARDCYIWRYIRFPTEGYFNLKLLYVCSESTKQNKNMEWCNLAQ